MAKLPFYEGANLYFVTFTLNKHAHLFKNAIYRDIVIDSLKFCVNQRHLRIFAYVIMSSHLHLIVFDSNYNNKRLKTTIDQFRSFTAHEILKKIKVNNPDLLLNFIEKSRTDREYRIWTDGFHAIGLDTEQKLKQRFDYIHNNPVKALLVEDPKQWIYSSASYWEDGEIGPLPIHHFLDVDENG